jgi:hypothetical protein
MMTLLSPGVVEPRERLRASGRVAGTPIRRCNYPQMQPDTANGMLERSNPLDEISRV